MRVCLTEQSCSATVEREPKRVRPIFVAERSLTICEEPGTFFSTLTCDEPAAIEAGEEPILGEDAFLNEAAVHRGSQCTLFSVQQWRKQPRHRRPGPTHNGTLCRRTEVLYRSAFSDLLQVADTADLTARSASPAVNGSRQQQLYLPTT